LWFTELEANAIGRTTTAGVTTEYPIPTPATQPYSITSGSDGALWFTESTGAAGTSKIGRITTAGVITEYAVPTNSAGPNHIAAGPDGALWFTERIRGKIGRISTAGDVTEYVIPGINSTSPTGITAGPDGALWFAESDTNQIGRISTAGALTQYSLPQTFNDPYGITAGSDGALWFTNRDGGQIGRISTTGAATVYTIPTRSDVPDITAGPDGALWFTNGLVARITTAGVLTEYQVPTAQALPYGITNGPDGALWFTEWYGNQIGRLDPAPAAPANLTAPTPTAHPALTWAAVSSATSYSIYRNGTKIDSSTTAAYTDNAAAAGTYTYYVTATNTNGESDHSNSVSVTVTSPLVISGAVSINGQPLPVSPYVHGSVILTDHGGTARAIAHTDSSSNYSIDVSGLLSGSYGLNFQYSGTWPQLDSNNTNLPDQFLLRSNNWPIDYAYSAVTQNLAFTTNRLTIVVKDTQGNPISTQISVGNVGDSTIANNDGSGTFTVVGGYTGTTNYTDATGTMSSGVFPNATYRACTSNGSIGNVCRTFTVTGDTTVTITPVPGAPANLTVPSPTQTPVLSWSATSGASSYKIYRDDVVVGTSATSSFTDTGAPVGQHDYYVTATNSSGESSPSNGVTVNVVSPVAITSTATASTGMRVPFDFSITTTGSPAAVITQTGALPSGIALVDNGDGTANLSGIALAGTNGSYPITITADNGVGGPATQSFVLTVTTATATPAITSSNNDTETYGVPFSFTVATTGYPAPKLTKTGVLPAGVTFTNNNDGTATLAGTPAAAAVGTYNLTIKAKSTASTVTQNFVLIITKAPVIKKIPATTAHAGVAFSMRVTTSGFDVPAITQGGTLPGGLAFTDNGDGTATLAGTPATGTGGAYAITITASNPLGTSSQTFTLKVNEAPVITSVASASATAGTPFSFPVTTTGYPAPAVTKSGILPRGVTFQGATDTFTGTPRAGTAGAYPVTITAKNSSGAVTQSFVITVQ
jgi:streptogramin lyase